MLHQIQYRFTDGHHELVAQNEIRTRMGLDAWFEQVKATHPKPEGAQWYICTEKSPHFFVTAGNGQSKVNPEAGTHIEVVPGPAFTPAGQGRV